MGFLRPCHARARARSRLWRATVGRRRTRHDGCECREAHAAGTRCAMVTTAAPSRVVRVDGSHLHALTEFYREVWDRAATVSGVQQSRAAAAERNIADPGAAIPTYLFMRGERALGHLTTIPLRLWLDQSDRAAHWLKGLMVLPEARNGPVGFLLLKSAIAELNPTLALVVE